MFEYETSVRLHDTDAAGLLFFANQFRMAHDAYEAFMISIGYDFGSVLRTGKFLLPIVHASADYTAPLFVGDPLKIEVKADEISEHSFVLGYRFAGKSGAEVGRVRTVHVCIGMDTKEKMALPDELRGALEKIKA